MRKPFDFLTTLKVKYVINSRNVKMCPTSLWLIVSKVWEISKKLLARKRFSNFLSESILVVFYFIFPRVFSLLYIALHPTTFAWKYVWKKKIKTKVFSYVFIVWKPSVSVYSGVNKWKNKRIHTGWRMREEMINVQNTAIKIVWL